MRTFFRNMVFVLMVGFISCGSGNDMSLGDLSQSVPNEPPVEELQGTWYFTGTLESDECDLASLGFDQSIDNTITITETDCQIGTSTSTQLGASTGTGPSFLAQASSSSSNNDEFSDNGVDVVEDCFAGRTTVAIGARVSASNEECNLYGWENDILELNENGTLDGTFEGGIKISGACLSEFPDELAAQLPNGCSVSGTIHGSQAETVLGGYPTPSDSDADGIPNDEDNCVAKQNPDQADSDGDSIGDACEADGDHDNVIDDDDNCPEDVNNDQMDSDEDGIGDACETDSDYDGVIDDDDNCPEDDNYDQADSDGDGIGDACESIIDLTNVTIEPTPPEILADMIADFLND